MDLENDSDVIRAWYDRQDAEIQAKADVIVEAMRTTPPEWWRMPKFRRLRGACEGLSTIRIISDEKVHHRIFGFFGPGEEIEYTLVLPMKRDDDPDYSRSGPEAFRRRDSILIGECRIEQCSFPEDSGSQT